MDKLRSWFNRHYEKITGSIAFYPALIAIAFLLLSFAMTALDFSEPGKRFKDGLSWLTLKDATTARSIISSIVSGIISLSVFSFSMVMIVLNQTASQMSNRILDNLIGNRFQQIVLGFYIGTIVFALFLLSTIRDVSSGIYIPAISTYFLIVLTIADIYLFIYFLHYITQSVKYEVIIQRIYDDTMESLKKLYANKGAAAERPLPNNLHDIHSPETGIFAGLYHDKIVSLCDTNNCELYIHVYPGKFIFKGDVIASASCNLQSEPAKELLATFIIEVGETITQNYFYGFRQLAEVALKALSPGINDPATAVQAMRALARLFNYRLQYSSNNILHNKSNKEVVFTTQIPVNAMLQRSLLPIFDYGKEDRMVLLEFDDLLKHLSAHSSDASLLSLQADVTKRLKDKFAYQP